YHDQPGQRADSTRHGLAALGPERRDVVGSGHGECATGLLDPGRTMETLPIGHYVVGSYLVAAPCAGARLALQADVVEDGGGLSEATGPLRHCQVARGGDEEPNLHRGRQPGQVSRADLGPVRAVGRLVAGERVTGAGQPEP